MNTKEIVIKNFNDRSFRIDYYGLTKNDGLLLQQKPLLLVFPGGAFCKLARREGEPVCFAYGSRGYNTAIVKYNLLQDEGSVYPDAALSGLSAIKYFRDNSEEYGINPDKIIAIGFSAGAHVVSVMDMMSQSKEYQNKFYFHKDEVKLNAVILGYPLIDFNQALINLNKAKILDDSKLINIATSVTPRTAPTFIFQSVDDPILSINNTFEYITALKDNDVKFEAHIFDKGGHGYSLSYPELKEKYEIKYGFNPRLHAWFDLSLSWLKDVLG